jgi:uncharacterized membrane protein
MNDAHLHLMVNHLPIVGFAIGLSLLGLTVLKRGDRGVFLAALLVLAISGAGALAAQFTGEPAEEVVEHLPDVPKALIETHEGAAQIATILASITLFLTLVIGVITLRRDGRITILPLSILLVATVATCGAMTWTGSTGGKIRHTEIRDSSTKAPASPTKHSD